MHADGVKSMWVLGKQADTLPVPTWSPCLCILDVYEFWQKKNGCILWAIISCIALLHKTDKFKMTALEDWRDLKK